MEFPELNITLDTIYRSQGTPLTCIVRQNHQKLFHYEAGEQKLELCNLYSITKVFTCVLAMQLWEQGMLCLNDPLCRYIPGFDERIRIEDLFCMASGLDYEYSTPELDALRCETGGRMPTLPSITYLGRKPLLFAPGTHWKYGLSHDVLGGVIVALSESSLEQTMRRQLLDPLGLAQTSFDRSPTRCAHMSTQYMLLETGEKCTVEGNAFVFGTEYESGGAGLLSSAEDCSVFADALACGGVGENGRRILRSETIDKMRRNRLSDVQLQDLRELRQFLLYGYGLGVRTMLKPRADGPDSPIGEIGWGGAAGAYMLVDPQNRLSMYVGMHLLQTSEEERHPLYRHALYKDFSVLANERALSYT